MIVPLAAVWCALIVQALSLTIPSVQLEKQFRNMDLPMARFVEERESLRELLRRMHPELREKRVEGLSDYVGLEDPNAKRSSLKRLAILSARGFGRK